MNASEEEIYNKLTEIELIEDSATPNVNRLLELSKDEDDEIRYRAFELLICHQLPEVKQQVLIGLNDSEELVRVACLEILGYWEEEDCLEQIRQLLISDESFIVQSYAALALAEIGNKTAVAWIKEVLPDAVGGEEYFFLSAALYHLGEKNYLNNVFDGLRDPFYRSRCASANLLADYCTDDSTRALILSHLSAALEVETTIAAESSIQGAIANIIEDSKQD
ncbi:MAG: HEAT repeat domain-containing protein [Thiotrichaceae bacterium]|nr:HEAT repeat domain-containing protein [Thiotrichaceae bacterium]